VTEASVLLGVVSMPKELGLCQWELSRQLAEHEVAAGHQGETGLTLQSGRRCCLRGSGYGCSLGRHLCPVSRTWSNEKPAVATCLQPVHTSRRYHNRSLHEDAEHWEDDHNDQNQRVSRSTGQFYISSMACRSATVFLNMVYNPDSDTKTKYSQWEIQTVLRFTLPAPRIVPPWPDSTRHVSCGSASAALSNVLRSAATSSPRAGATTRTPRSTVRLKPKSMSLVRQALQPRSHRGLGRPQEPQEAP